MRKTPKELSSEYYQFVNSFTQTSFEDEKMLGKFYTDHDIAESMIHIIRDIYKPDSIHVCVILIYRGFSVNGRNTDTQIFQL